MERTFRTMGLHPAYLDTYKIAHDRLINGGPISTVDRLHIALMAVARHSCVELLNVHEAELKLELDVRNEDAPATMKTKLKRLDQINKLLAHQPWAIKKHHIKDLLRNGESASDKWNLNELVTAIVILCHFHALSSFVLGCGILNEPTAETPDPYNKENPEVLVDEILKKMEDLMENTEELDLNEVARRFESTNKEAKDILVYRRSRSSTSASVSSDSPDDQEIKFIEPAKYTTDMDFQYVDYVKRSNPNESPTFREQEFNWANNAFNLLQMFVDDEMAKTLDDKFIVISKLTYRNIGKYESVDTSLFRMAVQRYAQCLFGIRHDDYNYSQINILLPRNLKTYIKTLCCFPERCTVNEYEAIMTDFRNSEKVHVCLLVCEAKLQAELLYGLRAVYEYYETS